MGWERIKIRAPHLKPGHWLNAERAWTMEELVGRGIVLADFWDYSCVNCIRTLPYLIEWHERYAPLGLTILGIHTPEFDFAREPEAVEAAVRRFGIPYPVLLDNETTNWYAFSNRAWPTKYLIDAQRVIRYRTMGEGRYGETEAAIQTLLRELHGEELALPPLMAPLRPTDVPGAVCYPTTPELFAGYAHGRLGNPGDFGLDEVRRFEAVAERETGKLYFEGPWLGSAEYSESAGAAQLRVPYLAAELNAVLATAEGAPQRLYLEQDGQPLAFDEAGEDVVVDSEQGSYVNVGAPRMYNLAINPDYAPHEITLFATEPGLRVYSFTFVSCPRTGE